MSRQNHSKRQRGNIILLTALMLPVLLGFTALAIDVGYLFVVRNELQNAADAAAMAGAGYLFQGATAPNWPLAQTKQVAGRPPLRSPGFRCAVSGLRAGVDVWANVFLLAHRLRRFRVGRR